jgi:hypothetical protein
MSTELTAAERAELELDLQDYWHEADLTGPPMDKVLNAVARIKAAARREALLEAAEEVEVGRVIVDGERRRAEKAEAKVARVEALAASASWVPLRTDRTEVTRHVRMVKAADITAALAEPERDEEGR